MREAIRTQRPICLDSGPLIDYISQLQPVTRLIEPIVLNTDLVIVISSVTLTEVITRPARDHDVARVEAIHQALHEMPQMTIIDFDQRHAVEAAYVRGSTALKLPDAVVVATARLAGASALIGNDRQWRNRPLGVPYHHMDDIIGLG